MNLEKLLDAEEEFVDRIFLALPPAAVPRLRRDPPRPRWRRQLRLRKIRRCHHHRHRRRLCHLRRFRPPENQ